MRKLVEEHARVQFHMSQPEKNFEAIDKEIQLIQILEDYEGYDSFSEYFDNLFDVLG